MTDPVQMEAIDTDDAVVLDRWLAIRNAIDPRPMSPAAFRAELAATTHHLELLATLDGRDVGAGGTAWTPMSAEAGMAFVEAWVAPEARRHRVGSAIVEQSLEFARTHRMRTVRASVVEGDAGSLAFAARYGLEVVGGAQVGHLHLTADHDTPASSGSDIVLVSLAERPDLVRAVYDLDVLVQPEVPTLAIEPTPSFEAWESSTTGDPGFLPELSVVALRDGEVVGAIHTYDNAEGTVFIGMTAVHPAARRQGIARALKTELAARAVRAGWTRLETFNDLTNERMRGLNIELGYVYLPRLLMLKGLMPPPRTA